MAENRNYQEVEIYLSGHDFPKLDTFSKSDPFLVLYTKDPVRKVWREKGRTETIQDNHFPVFEKRFKMQYIFEQEQNLRIEAYDEDAKDRDLRKHDYVGSVEFILGEVVHHPGGTMRKVLMADKQRKGKKVRNKKSKKYTTITITVEEIEQCNDILHLNLGASKLPKMDWFGSADPFLEFFRLGQGDSNKMVKVFSTEVLKNNRNPSWKPISIGVTALCNGDYDRPLVIKCQDWNKNGTSDLIGEMNTNLHELMNMQGQSVPLKLPGKSGKKRGKLDIRKSGLEKRHTFIEFLRGGMNMRLLLAIDFTGSNGHWLDHGTLHFRDKQRGTSQYMDAISEVGRIVEVYNSEKVFACWGFGAKVDTSRVSHCFPLTLGDNPNVIGTQGILRCYTEALDSNRLTFSGPTLFEHIVRAAAQVACDKRPSEQVYCVLLILTDGVVNDMQKTINAIVEASKLPLSIIIVGIGGADFGNMEILDADDTPLVSSKGVVMDRDIVQFVPYRDFRNTAQGALAQAVLAELPDQVVGYYSKMQISPNKATAAQFYGNNAFAAQTTIFSMEGSRTQPGLNPLPGANVDLDRILTDYDEEKLPPGWEKKYDKSSGKHYYIDHNTQQTSWTVPTFSRKEATI